MIGSVSFGFLVSTDNNSDNDEENLKNDLTEYLNLVGILVICKKKMHSVLVFRRAGMGKE